MQVFISGISSLDELEEQPEREFETVIKLDEMAEAGVRSVEFVNVVETVEIRDDEQPRRMNERIAALTARVAELERRIGIVPPVEQGAPQDS